MKNTRTIEEIKDEFDDLGYNLITDTYANYSTIITYYCDKGHKNEKSYGSSRKLQHRCTTCSNERQAEKCRKYTMSELRSIFMFAGYELLSTEYTSLHKK